LNTCPTGTVACSSPLPVSLPGYKSLCSHLSPSPGALVTSWKWLSSHACRRFASSYWFLLPTISQSSPSSLPPNCLTSDLKK
jgi:hypothetical protein